MNLNKLLILATKANVEKRGHCRHMRCVRSQDRKRQEICGHRTKP